MERAPERGKGYGRDMISDAQARAVRAGGWAALAVAAFGVARLVALAGLLGPSHAGAAGWTALLLAAGLAMAVAQAVAVDRVRRHLGPGSRLIWTASASGWTGAALGLAGVALVGVRLLSAGPAEALKTGLILGWLPVFATALWAAGVCAADWRRLRLPSWLRVVGTLFAVMSLAAAVLPFVGALALPLSLAWWIGLGVVLLRAPRSTSG